MRATTSTKTQAEPAAITGTSIGAPRSPWIARTVGTSSAAPARKARRVRVSRCSGSVAGSAIVLIDGWSAAAPQAR